MWKTNGSFRATKEEAAMMGALPDGPDFNLGLIDNVTEEWVRMGRMAAAHVLDVLMHALKCRPKRSCVVCTDNLEWVQDDDPNRFWGLFTCCHLLGYRPSKVRAVFWRFATLTNRPSKAGIRQLVYWLRTGHHTPGRQFRPCTHRPACQTREGDVCGGR